MSFPRYESYKESGLSWLGKIPSHWGIMQSRRLFSLRKDKATETDRQLTASQKHGVLYQDDYTAIEGQKVVQVITGAEILKHAEPNDFVISMRSFQGGIEWCGYRGSISSAYVMLIPSDTINVRFFSYLFKCKPYIQALQSTSNLVRDGQALRYDNFTLIHLPVLPYLEQQTIAAFLDRETAKIDALIAEQQRLIELLKEKRQSVISHAVTKGLNPNAPMKDSGIEWLGEVPEHWEVTRLKFLMSDIKAGPFGSNLTKDMYVSSGYRIYGQEQVIPNDFSIGDYYITEEKYQELKQYQITTGDILISCVGTFGKIAIVPRDIEPGVINPRLMRLRCSTTVTSEYLVTILRSIVVFEQFSFLSRGGTMDVVNIGTLNEIVLSVPKISEQSTIVRFVKSETAKFDTLTAEAQTAITLLQERRTALISAAVTGKIDVRGLVSAKTEVKAETVPC
jgi:type I restriction enzyme S subunit